MKRISMLALSIKPRDLSRHGTYSRRSACRGYIWPTLSVAGAAALKPEKRVSAFQKSGVNSL
jgi:hypothetical protein